MKTFPNGFTSWVETHHEVVSFITKQLELDDLMTDGTTIRINYESGGIGRMYELAEDWTDQFENDNNGRDWDGEFFDELEYFLIGKNKG